MEKRSRRRLGPSGRGFEPRHSDQNCGIVRAKAAGIVSLRLSVFPMTEQERHAVHGERIAVGDHVGSAPGKAGRAAVAGVGPGAVGVRRHVHGDDLGGDGLAGAFSSRLKMKDKYAQKLLNRKEAVDFQRKQRYHKNVDCGRL